eukprot:2629540-Prymnesium_polylepis.2
MPGGGAIRRARRLSSGFGGVSVAPSRPMRVFATHRVEESPWPLFVTKGCCEYIMGNNEVSAAVLT